MEGTCNECVFPLNKGQGLGTCPNDTSLIYAAGEGKLFCVKELIAAGVDVNIGCECHGNGALLSATANGHFDCSNNFLIPGLRRMFKIKKGTQLLCLLQL